MHSTPTTGEAGGDLAGRGSSELGTGRTLDAIHLATLERLARAVTPLSVLSTDDRVRRNAESPGFDVLQ